LLSEKIVSLDTKFDTKIKSLEKRLDFQSKLLILILAAILGMFGTLVIFLFNLTKII